MTSPDKINRNGDAGDSSSQEWDNVVNELFSQISATKQQGYAGEIPENDENSETKDCLDLILLKLIKTPSQPTKRYNDPTVASTSKSSYSFVSPLQFSTLPAPGTARKSRKKRFRFFEKMVSGVLASNSRRQPQDDPVRKKMLKAREEHAKKQKFDYSHVFRNKSRFDLMRLSIIIMGIDFAFAAETAFVSPILLEIGISHEHMTMVWALSPLFGFFLAPLMGSLSDRCRSPWGRRRPMMLILTIGILLGLLLVPYGKDVGRWLGDKQEIDYVQYVQKNNSKVIKYNAEELDSPENYTTEHEYGFKWAVIATVLGTVLLDFDADNCQTPSRAYLLDVCLAEDHAKALSTFTIMAGIGGFLGYSLGGFDWSETQIGVLFGGNIKTVFAIVTIILIVTSFCSFTSFREIPLPLMEKDEMLRPVTHADIVLEKEKITKAHLVVKNRSEIQLAPAHLKIPKIQPTKSDVETASIADSSDDEYEDIATLSQYLKSIVIMPKALRILCLTNLLCWMGYLSYCLYFTDFVAESVFHGDPSPNSENHSLYDQGVRFGCWGLAISALACAIYSKIIEYLIKWFRTKIVYICGLLVFSIGMCILGTYPTKVGVLAISITAGIIYATIFTIPFLLVANYHAKGSFKNSTGDSMVTQPANKRGLGTDIAVVGSMVFLAQIIISLSIGAIVKAVGTTKVVLWVASGCSLLASISASKVIYMDL